MTSTKTPDMEAERERFEAEMRKHHPEWAFSPDPVFEYHNERTRLAWEGWLARASQAEPVAPSPGCSYCTNPLFIGSKCKNCGRVTESEPVAAPTKEQCAQCTGTDESPWCELTQSEWCGRSNPELVKDASGTTGGSDAA